MLMRTNVRVAFSKGSISIANTPTGIPLNSFWQFLSLFWQFPTDILDHEAYDNFSIHDRNVSWLKSPEEVPMMKNNECTGA
jgi:hypothetical protein